MSDASVNGQETTTTSNKNSPTPRPEPKSTPAQTPTPTCNPKQTPTVNQSPTHILSPTPANTPTPSPATLRTESSTPTVISALSLTPAAVTSSLSTQNPTTKSAKSTSIDSPMHISTPSQSHPTPTTLPTPPPTPTSTTTPTKNPSRTSAQTTPESIINPTSSRTPSPTTAPTASSIQSSELSTTPIQTPNRSNMPMSSLKQNYIDLKKLVNEARTISNHIENSYEPTTFKRIEEKTSTPQNAVLDFTKSAQMAKPQISETASPIIEPKKEPQNIALEMKEEKNASMAVKCNNWEDFQAFAQKAEIVSFTYRDENEKLFEANALKNNQIITYIGEIPQQDQLLKMWLSSILVTSEKNIFQGTISKA